MAFLRVIVIWNNNIINILLISLFHWTYFLKHAYWSNWMCRNDKELVKWRKSSENILGRRVWKISVRYICKCPWSFVVDDEPRIKLSDGSEIIRRSRSSGQSIFRRKIFSRVCFECRGKTFRFTWDKKQLKC